MPSNPTAPLKETQVYNHLKYNGQWCTRGKAKGKENSYITFSTTVPTSSSCSIPSRSCALP